MSQFSAEELEQAFRRYWQAGAVNEDWDGFADCFTEDARYIEHVLGNMNGREEIRKWIHGIMAQFRSIYTVYEWHTVDPSSGRVIMYMQNRRDHPSGTGVIDFPGITVLQYAGNGLFRSEEDYWSVPGARQAEKLYREACEQFDPEHPQRGTRLNWGNGPDWTQGAKSFDERPRA